MLKNIFTSNIKLLILGALAGLLGGLLGIGGGTIIVPMLVLILGLDQKKAQGTSLLCATLIALAGVIPYTIHGNINYTNALFIIIGAIIGAIVGSGIMKRTKNVILRNVFVFLLIYVGVNMIYTGINHRDLYISNMGLDNHLIFYGSLFFIGMLSGILSGLLGIGGGLVMVPCMLLIGIEQKVAQGISLLCMIPTAITGVLSQAKAKNVNFKVGTIVGVSSMIFSVIGANITSYITTDSLKIGFGIFMIFVSLMMFFSNSKNHKSKDV